MSENRVCSMITTDLHDAYDSGGMLWNKKKYEKNEEKFSKLGGLTVPSIPFTV